MNRKIPRGKGYDKASILRHLKVMTQDAVFVTTYARAHKLHLDTFMLAIKMHIGESPDNKAYLRVFKDPNLISATCEYCGETFYPARKARFCTARCGATSRKDQEYFGGKRRQTKGLAESVCQLCHRSVTKGLSSHHIYGKANDTGNEYLLALCSGCHAIVSDLALKTWCADPEVLARLIWLGHAQRYGAEMIKLRQEEGTGKVWTVSHTLVKYDQS